MRKSRATHQLEQDVAFDEALLQRLEKREELVQTLADWPSWLKTLELDVDSSKPGQAYYDSRPCSPHYQMVKALDDKSIRGLAIFAPRGIGKTYSILLPWILREIVLDPTVTFLVGSESLKMSSELRTTWLRTKLELLQDKGYGNFKSKRHWGKDSFTVNRPAGTGGQPTVVAWGPESVGTGRHWQNGAFDDLYGDMSAESSEVRQTITRKFMRLLPQRVPGTRMILMGTMWQGRETFYYRLRTDPKLKDIFTVMVFDVRDESRNLIFPCLTPEFLREQQAMLPPAIYDAQYRNRITDDDELMFEPGDFHLGEPPPDTPIATYMVTDSAFTLKTDRRASRSCIAIIQKTPDNTAYVMDVEIGTWPADMFPRKLIDMFQKWRVLGYPPIHYCMETQGPGGQYPAHIEDVALLQGVESPECFPVSHARSDKTARIEKSRGPIRSGRILFSPRLDRSMFYIDGTGEPCGLLGVQYMMFTHDSNLRFDGPDAIADVHCKDAYGRELCPAPAGIVERKPLTLYQKAMHQLHQQQRRRIYN